MEESLINKRYKSSSTRYKNSHVRPPLIDCLFPVRCPRLLLPATSLPFFSQVRHMRMCKSIKRYVMVMELTNPHHGVQLFACPRVFDHIYGTGNNQSNTHGLNYAEIFMRGIATANYLLVRNALRPRDWEFSTPMY